STPYYDDGESNIEFAARLDAAIIPPFYNNSAGQISSSPGNAAAFVTDQGLFFPGANLRIKPGFGAQIYNFTTGLNYTILVTGAAGQEQIGIDAGNPN
ncbi:MAG TPA: hypothetical protein VFB72_18510, partial [Verrucomicrobiae bacterium]|nr:hypothetical protein [Verrucomicrobiae bacterium]